MLPAAGEPAAGRSRVAGRAAAASPRPARRGLGVISARGGRSPAGPGRKKVRHRPGSGGSGRSAREGGRAGQGVDAREGAAARRSPEPSARTPPPPPPTGRERPGGSGPGAGPGAPGPHKGKAPLPPRRGGGREREVTAEGGGPASGRRGTVPPPRPSREAPHPLGSAESPHLCCPRLPTQQLHTAPQKPPSPRGARPGFLLLPAWPCPLG